MLSFRIIIFFLLFLPAFLANGQSYFPVTYRPEMAGFAPYVARTANLLNTSKPDHPQEVRIMVYGQSISEQKWWEEVKVFMENRYPNAQINMINKAIGGFSTDRLKLMVENDVVSFYPDLILFHDFGNEQDYEQILRTIRSKTTAEVALQTDHIGVGQNLEWHDKHGQVVLPALAKKYGLALIDVRSAWKEYLAENKLEAAELLSDNVHLNDHGNYLMAEIIKKYWKALPETQFDTHAEIKVLKAGQDFKRKKQTIILPVEGNRIDLIWNKSLYNSKPIKVTIDGKSPSDYEGCYYHTRPALQENTSFLSHIGSLLAVRLGDDVQEEEWKLTITAVDSIQQEVAFQLWGSLSGDDGAGSSERLFTSRSGKIIIEPQNWFRRKNKGDFSQFHWLKVENTINWKVKSMCKDIVKPEKDAWVTVLQGIPNGKHQLKISGESLEELREIKVYQPPLKE